MSKKNILGQFLKIAGSLAILFSCSDSSLDTFRSQATTQGIGSTAHSPEFQRIIDAAQNPTTAMVEGYINAVSYYPDTVVYAFDVVAGSTTQLLWDDSFEGSGHYTCDIYVSVYDGNGNLLLSDRDSGYEYPVILNPTTNKIYVLAYSNYTGTFALAVNAALNQSLIERLQGQSVDVSLGDVMSDYLSDGDSSVYHYNVSPGTTYRLMWDDSWQGSGVYSSDVYVTVVDAYGTYLFQNEDSGFSSPRSIMATSSDLYVIVRASNTGNFAVSMSIANLGLEARLQEAIWIDPSNDWIVGNMTNQSSGKDTIIYAMPTEINTEYSIQWDDSYQGTGLYTADVYITILDAMGNVISNRKDSGFNFTSVFTPTTGHIYILVDQYSSSIGTFAIRANATEYFTSTSSSSQTGSSSSQTLNISLEGIQLRPELPIFEWVEDSIQPGDTLLYVFSGTIGGAYYIIQWDDSQQGTDTYSLDIQVMAFSELETIHFNWLDHGYSGNGLNSDSELTYLLVTAVNEGDSGTFRLRII